MRRPDTVLFACTRNAVRSPMAEGLMRMLHGRAIYVDSCGVEPDRQFDPFMAEVMDEAGAPLPAHGPQSFDELNDGSFDLIVTLSPEAHHNALDRARGKAVEVIYWPTPDPTVERESRDTREQILDAYRHTRDHLRRLIVERFGESLSLGG
jgi:protein-tyrosine-phosphatase